MTANAPRRAADILVAQLIRQQVTDIFCVPGESYLAVLDSLHDASIRVTVCRQEGGACMMADAVGRLTGRPGICFVTRGPGALNAAPAIHIAHQDSIPLILFVGQIERSARERGAFQELDYRDVFGSMTKWTTEIDDAARIPEIIHRAFHVAMSGRKGPVVIALPEDMLTEMASVADAPFVEPLETHPSLSQMAQLQKRLWAAKKPIVIAGGTGWSQQAVDRLVRFAEAFDLPVSNSFRRQMIFPERHSQYVGNLGIGPNPPLVKYIEEADLILAIGARIGEMPSQGYKLLDIPGDGERLIHVHAGSDELGRVYASTCRSMPAWKASQQPCKRSSLRRRSRGPRRAPRSMRNIANGPRCRRISPALCKWAGDGLPARQSPGGFRALQRRGQLRDLAAPLLHVQRLCDAGRAHLGLHGLWRARGCGVKRAFPEKTVVAFAGDGCFLMNGQDFATAVQYDLPIIVLVIDNRMYGTIRMHQEREFPGRVSATELKNPDFAAYARAFGGHGERVERTEEFIPAFERARASGKPAILHLLIDPEAITPTTTITAIRNRPR